MTDETASEIYTSSGAAAAPHRKPSASFYEHFTSLLRVQSNVTDLCQIKNNLQLPELQTRNDFPLTLKNQSLLSNRRNSELFAQVSPTALRSYLLSNTAKEQYEIATNRKNQSDLKRRGNQSLISLGHRNNSLSHVKMMLNDNSSAFLAVNQEESFKRSLFGNRHKSVTTRNIENNINESRSKFAESNLEIGYQDFDSKLKKHAISGKLNTEVKNMQKFDILLEEIPHLNLSNSKISIHYRAHELQGEATLKQQLSERDQHLIQKYRQFNNCQMLSPDARREILNQSMLLNKRQQVEQEVVQSKPNLINKQQMYEKYQQNIRQRQQEAQIQEALALPINEATGKVMHILEYQKNEDSAQDSVKFAKKNFEEKLFNANGRMLDLIHDQVLDLKGKWAVLDYQQKLQQNPRTKMAGFELFEKVKEIYIKEQQLREQKLKQTQKDKDGDTSKNHTSTVMSHTQKDNMTNLDRVTEMDQTTPFLLASGNESGHEEASYPDGSSFAEQTPKSKLRGKMELVFDQSPMIFEEQTENGDDQSSKKAAQDFSKFRVATEEQIKEKLQVVKSPTRLDKIKTAKISRHNSQSPNVLSSQKSSPVRKSYISRQSASKKLSIKVSHNSKRTQSVESNNRAEIYKQEIICDVNKVNEEFLVETQTISEEQSPKKNNAARNTVMPFTIFFRAFDLGVPVDVLLDTNPPPTFKDFVQKHFNQNESFESESIKTNSSFEDIPQYEQYEIPIEEDDQSAESSSSSSSQDEIKEVAPQVEAKKPKNPSFRINNKSYINILNQNVKMQKFVQTHQTDQLSSLSAFSMIQQIVRGRLIVKGLTFKNGNLSALLNIVISLKINIKIVIIDKCEITDADLRTSITSLAAFVQLTELALRDLHIGTLSMMSLFRLQQNLPGLPLNFSRCSFSTNFDMGIEKLITPNILPLKNLSLRDSHLIDKHLDILSNRVQQLHHIDLSRNNFTGSSLLYFLETVANSRMKSLAIAGNSTKTDQPLKMRECLKNIVKSEWMQHLDLTDTGLDLESVEELAGALNEANTLVSIHLSFSQEIRKTIHKVLGNLIQNRAGFNSSKDLIPDDWFKKPNLPHLIHDDISGQVCNTLTEIPKYVLSRFIGRKYICNYFDLKGDEFKVPEEILRQKNPIEREAEIREIQNQRCWMESDQCWICQRWSYCVPLITKHDIDESFYPGTSQTLYTLNEVRQRVLDRLIEKEKESYDAMQLKEAYIIGEMTDFKFVRMDQMHQYMLKLDTNSSQVLVEQKGKISDIHKYYLPKFKVLFKQDSAYKRKKHLRKKQIKERFSLAPYIPHLVQLEPMDVDEYTNFSEIWMHSCFMKPGLQEFFIVFKFDQNKVFKTQMSTVNPIRNQAIHNYTIPVIRKHKNHEEYPNTEAFNILNSWKPETQKSLVFTFETDVKMWQFPGDKGQIQGLQFQDDPQEYQALLKKMNQHLAPLQMSHKYLLSRSNTYPLINYMQIQDWVINDLKIIKAPEFTKKQFDSIYRDCKQFSLLGKEDPSADNILTKKELRRKSVRLFATKKNLAVNKLPDNQLTRYMFYELIVRIASHKFRQNSFMTGDFDTTPSKCFDIFMTNLLVPWIQRTVKFDHNVQEADSFIQKDILSNELVQKLMFQNQFVLQKIYDQMLTQSGDARELHPRPYQGEQPVKEKQEEIIYGHDSDEEKEKVEESPSKLEKQLIGQSLGKSPTKLKGSLKNLKTIGKKNQKLVVKREFLNLGPPLAGLNYKYFYQRLLEIKSQEISHHINTKTFQYFIVFSKMTINHSNNQRLVVLQDLERYDRLFFTEFLILICFLANDCFSMLKQNNEPFTFVEKLAIMLQVIIAHFNEKYNYFDLNDEIVIPGIDKISNIYLEGQIKTFVPPTPVSQRRSEFEAELNSNCPDLEDQVISHNEKMHLSAKHH